MAEPRIVWLRRDLRLADQPAFRAAADTGPVIPVYVLDDDAPGDHRLGGAARWWLHGSLAALATSLEARGSRLVVRRGDAARELAAVARETGASGVDALRHYEPWWREAERALAGTLDLRLHDGNYLRPPGSVTTGAGAPFKIYTPFARAMLDAIDDPAPRAAPKLAAPASWPTSLDLDSLGLLPAEPDWAGGMREAWTPGEDAAHRRLDHWLGHVAGYQATRNLPSQDGSSRLSPHLQWGELSSGQVWHALAGAHGEGADTFRRELIWRDFAQNLIAQFPDYGRQSYRREFDRFPWRYPDRDRAAAADLGAWRRGRTGYPIVDAGMRQLWTTGWMHNRVRMIAASFLIKHLLIDWRAGERWFWDTLVDADYGNNSVNWQWVAGGGVDASQFTRIMAPLTQSPKFAAAGYIRAWVPELAGLADADVHDPPEDARPAGYPAPLIGHRAARERALAAYRAMKARG